jgi:flagellar basal body-associated protein FliL
LTPAPGRENAPPPIHNRKGEHSMSIVTILIIVVVVLLVLALLGRGFV